MRRLAPLATRALLLGFCWSLCACSSGGSSGDPAATAGASGSAVGCRQSDGDVYAPGLQKQGAAGRFGFTLVSSTPAPPALDDNSFVVQVTDADGNGLDGELSVVLDMPEHGHMGSAPKISFDAERSAFVLEPVHLFMVGMWRFTFSFRATVDGAPLADSAVFEFCID